MVLAGQAAGEFGPVNAEDFAMTLTALLDGLAIQIALGDPSVSPAAHSSWACGSCRASWDSNGPGGHPPGKDSKEGARCPVDISSWSR